MNKFLIFFALTFFLLIPAFATTVEIKTSMGSIFVQLNEEKAPLSSKNFLKYVEDKFYDKTIFHRVIKDFMIQGGGMTEKLTEKKTRDPIANEARNELSNKRGTISMARTNDIDSATSQFFINVVDNDRLDYVNDKKYGYAVFGEVTKGLDVVDKIRNAKTGIKNGMQDVPDKTIEIKSIRIVKEKESKKGKK